MPLRFSPNRGAGALALSAYVRGPTGAAATISVGTVSALAEGATPTVTNSGSSSVAVLDFGIPRGVIPTIGFNFDTSTTDADPGAGDVRFNNATPASVTAIYFDNVDRDGNTVTAWLDSFDDSTTTAKGTLVITPAATPSAKLIYAVSGTVVDGTGYRKVTVAHVSGTTLPSSAAHLAFQFAATGDKGANGSGTFPGSSTDNAVVRFDGAAGSTVQNSGVIVDDSNNVSGVATLTTSGNIELGNASDTTISRTGAGAIAVEGVGVALNSTSLTHTAATIELGAATDTTISRASAGVIAVEGVNLTPNIPITSKSTAYTVVLTDANTAIYHPSSDNNPRTFTIDSNANVAYPVGTCLTFINEINTVTIAITSDTLTQAGTGSTGSRTLAANGMATAIKVASTKWVISGAGLT